jgi:sugar phosphate isomerase/epimerase
MVCGYRSVISSLSEANDLLDHLNRDDVYGIAVDTYALWWDSNLQQQIRRSGKRLINFHVSDWLTETKDLRLDRGMPGDGIIDNPLIRGWMEESEYQGSIEIEILSALNWWKQPSETVIKAICQSLANL